MLTIHVQGQEIDYNLRNCYKRNRTIRTHKGLQIKLAVWNSYAPWGDSYSLIIRSVGGEYSTNLQIKDLDERVCVTLTKS